MTEANVDSCSVTDLISEVLSLLSYHPAGAELALMIRPAGLDLQPGEVLVQEVDGSGRGLSIKPKKFDDLNNDDTLVTGQLLGTPHAGQPQARAKCLVRYPDGPANPRHFHN